jgi:hypothetical protein
VLLVPSISWLRRFNVRVGSLHGRNAVEAERWSAVFRSKAQEDEPGLLRLQKAITSDRLRLQRRIGLVDADGTVAEDPHGVTSGRIYRVFVAMGEA